MQIAAVRNDQFRPIIAFKHDWFHLMYMSIYIVFLAVDVYQRISIDLFYASQDIKIHVPSLNRYPTALTPSSFRISFIWYLVFIWQAVCIIYSFIGIFRRTSSGSYFYQYPCAMNKSCFFYMSFGLILYAIQLTAASRNTYNIGASIFRYIGTFCEVIIGLVYTHIMLHENLRGYLKDKYFIDVWLTRLLYHNGLALWASVLFYESCLSIVIGLIYSDRISSSTACIIGCILLLTGLICLSILENKFFDQALAFTLSHWFTFLWILSDIILHPWVPLSSSSSVSVQLLVISVFCVTFFLTATRLSILCVRHKFKALPTINSGKVYSPIVEPTPF